MRCSVYRCNGTQKSCFSARSVGRGKKALNTQGYVSFHLGDVVEYVLACSHVANGVWLKLTRVELLLVNFGSTLRASVYTPCTLRAAYAVP